MDIVRGMLHAIPVEFGPHEADWLMVIATVLAAGATVYVASRAQKVSKRAAATAEKTEKARLDFEERAHAEAQQVALIAARARYEQSLDDALASLFRTIREHLDKNSQQSQFDTFLASWRASSDSPLAPPLPRPEDTFAPVLTEFEVLRLRVRGDDLKVASAAAKAVEKLDGPVDREKSLLIHDFVATLRRWRTGEASAEDTVGFLLRIANE